MKSFVIGGVSALALMSVAGVASAQSVSTGYVGVEYAKIEDSTLKSIVATGSLDLAPNWEIQGDLTFGTFENPFVDNDIWSATAHGFYDGGNFKAGVFLGQTDYDGADLTGYGVEGRLNLAENWTLGGSIGRGQLDVGPAEVDVDAMRVELSAFFSDRTRVDLSISDITFDFGPLAEANSTAYGFALEHQLEAYPVSLNVGFENANTDFGAIDTYSFGVRYVFGGTLKDRDRSSSPFGNVQKNFGGAASAYLGVVAAFVADDLEEEEDYDDCQFSECVD